MATDLERLTVSLEANVKKFESELNKARGLAVKTLRDVERESSKVEKGVSAALNKVGGAIRGAFVGISAGVLLNEFRKTADEYTRIVNSLKVAGVSGAALPNVLDQLFASAQRNAVPLESLAQLYGRVSQAQTTLKASSAEVLQVTDIVAQSLRVAGKSASESSGALLQLSQAFSNGKVQAEEYNSLLDGAYPLLQAAAAGLKEAGGDVGKLTALVKDGKVSSEAFFRAIQAGAPILEEKLAGAVLTTDQAMQQLRNELTKAVGEFDSATGASAALAGGLSTLAGSISGIGNAATAAVTGVQFLINKVGELAAANAGAQRAQALTYQEERARRTDAAREMALGNSGGRAGLARDVSAADSAAAAASRAATAGFRQAEIEFANRLKTTPLPPTRPSAAAAGIKPVSLANFAVPGEKDGKGSGGSSSAEKLNAYEKELLAIEKRTKALGLEAEMVGKGTFAIAQSKAALDLESAAKKAGIPITEEMRAAIQRASEGYANAKVKVEEVTKAIDASKDAQKFLGDAAVDALEDIIVNGAKAEDVIKNLAKSLAKAAIQAALMGSGPLAGIFGTKGSDGGAGGLFGMLFSGIGVAGARAAGGPVHGNKPYLVGERGPEIFTPGRSGGIVPNSAMRRGGGLRVVIMNSASNQVQASAERQPNGDLTVMVSAIEAQMAQNAVRGKGSFAPALGAIRDGRQLRG